MRFATVLFSLPVVLSLVLGCSDAEPQPEPRVPVDPGSPITGAEQTPGDLGRLRFDYESSQCPKGCATERPVLEGSIVKIHARGGAGIRPLEARFKSFTLGKIVFRDRTCDGKRPEDCRLSIDIEAKGAGDGLLEIIDNDDNVMDQVMLHFRPASKMEMGVVRATKDNKSAREVVKGSDGVFEIRSGERLTFDPPRVFAADGAQLLFTKDGFESTYAETSVTVRAAGVESQLKFRVVP